MDHYKNLSVAAGFYGGPASGMEWNTYLGMNSVSRVAYMLGKLYDDLEYNQVVVIDSRGQFAKYSRTWVSRDVLTIAVSDSRNALNNYSTHDDIVKIACEPFEVVHYILRSFFQHIENVNKPYSIFFLSGYKHVNTYYLDMHNFVRTCQEPGVVRKYVDRLERLPPISPLGATISCKDLPENEDRSIIERRPAIDLITAWEKLKNYTCRYTSYKNSVNTLEVKSNKDGSDWFYMLVGDENKIPVDQFNLETMMHVGEWNKFCTETGAPMYISYDDDAYQEYLSKQGKTREDVVQAFRAKTSNADKPVAKANKESILNSLFFGLYGKKEEEVESDAEGEVANKREFSNIEMFEAAWSEWAPGAKQTTTLVRIHDSIERMLDDLEKKGKKVVVSGTRKQSLEVEVWIRTEFKPNEDQGIYNAAEYINYTTVHSMMLDIGDIHDKVRKLFQNVTVNPVKKRNGKIIITDTWIHSTYKKPLVGWLLHLCTLGVGIGKPKDADIIALALAGYYVDGPPIAIAHYVMMVCPWLNYQNTPVAKVGISSGYILELEEASADM